MIGARLRTPDGPRLVRSRWLIGADGARSSVSRRARRRPAGVPAPSRTGRPLRGHPGPRRPRRDARRPGLVRRPGADAGRASSTSAWRCRWPGAVAPRRRFAAAIDGMPRGRGAPRRPAARTPIRGVAPIGHRVSRAAGDGWLLVGDAAGFIDPFTGEGIFRALRSARAAAESLRRRRCGRRGALPRRAARCLRRQGHADLGGAGHARRVPAAARARPAPARRRPARGGTPGVCARRLPPRLRRPEPCLPRVDPAAVRSEVGIRVAAPEGVGLRARLGGRALAASGCRTTATCAGSAAADERRFAFGARRGRIPVRWEAVVQRRCPKRTGSSSGTPAASRAAWRWRGPSPATPTASSTSRIEHELTLGWPLIGGLAARFIDREFIGPIARRTLRRVRALAEARA